MQHWLGLLDSTPGEITELVRAALAVKAACRRGGSNDGAGAEAAAQIRAALGGKIMGMVFFNPSLRTRVSFESAMLQFGGHAISLSVGGDSWQLEHRDGAVMNSDKAEHIREAAPVLSRYCDVLGVRTFARLTNAAEDAEDAVLRAFGRHATVPVVSLESAIEHPCQGVADRITIEEKLGGARGRKFVLTWAPHIKALPMAVPHSAMLAAASAGMHVTLAHPAGYELNGEILARARSWCQMQGTRFEVTDDQKAACQNADALYVKSWGSAEYYGNAAPQTTSFQKQAPWMVTREHLAHPGTLLMHCLPVRRNVVIADQALDDPRCVVVDQAENRLWAQVAILARLLKPAQPAQGGPAQRPTR